MALVGQFNSENTPNGYVNCFNAEPYEEVYMSQLEGLYKRKNSFSFQIE